MFDKDKLREMLSFFTQARAESSVIFTGLAIGVFSMLVILKDITIFSLAWFALSISYWVLIFVGMMVLFSLFFNIVAINSLMRSYYGKLDEDIIKALENTKLTRKGYEGFFKDNNDNKFNKFSWLFVILLPILAGLLWYSIAFHEFNHALCCV